MFGFGSVAATELQPGAPTLVENRIYLTTFNSPSVFFFFFLTKSSVIFSVPLHKLQTTVGFQWDFYFSRCRIADLQNVDCSAPSESQVLSWLFKLDRWNNFKTLQ